ncbi:MAG TPA: hypothetical protein DD435_09380 [Cyanobacteria bacterium UBA8530]|nr:hypothetical protein [Cyanobacteria bacterium UBA8530]
MMRRRATAKTENPESSVTPLHPEEEENFNQRATFYFSEEQLMQLEVVMLKLRTEQRLKVGKSEIMRAALDFILEDYNQNKQECWLVRRLVGKK